MKVNFLSFILLSTCLCMASSTMIKDELDSHCKAVAFRVAGEAAEDIEALFGKKYKLHYGGFGGGLIDQINMIALIFFCHQELDMETSAQIARQCTKIFIDKINNDQEIIPYLAKYPADSDLTKIILEFDFKDTVEVSDIINCTAHRSTISFCKYKDKAIDIPLDLNLAPKSGRK